VLARAPRKLSEVLEELLEVLRVAANLGGGLTG
jgi:hypothetical protein